MKFTVLTPSFNCAPYLPTNLESVRSQGVDLADLEHWIVDGGSTDGTVEILKQAPGIRWISEPDKGLSDAVNKGLERAQGEWIIWLNADDALAPGALAAFQQVVVEHPGIKMFCGALTVLRYDGSTEQTLPGWDYNLQELLGSRTGINQPATFVHRAVYKKVGLLDVQNRYAMDYEWMVRAMHHFRCVPIPKVLAIVRRRKGSITDANMRKQFEEFLRLRRVYHRPRFSRAEFRIRFYLWTDGLRQIPWVRGAIRACKRTLGREPMHPM